MKNITSFSKARWIWLAMGESADQYAEFIDKFSYDGNAKVVMRISADSDYALYLNANCVASGQYGDFEHYKIYDELDLTPHLKNGENELKILGYHCGVSTSRYRPAAAGLIYEVVSGDRILAFSDENTLSRLCPTYESGRQVFVSSQLGFTFFYDATKESTEGYAPSVCVNKNVSLFPRPIKKHVLLDRKPIKSITKHSDTHYLIDLGGETVGLPTLNIYSDTEQTLTVAWGEHIADGGVRKQIGKRNFFFEYRTKLGNNSFTEPMLRIGCRYLEIFSEYPININYVGVTPQVYEVNELPCRIESELDRRIYDMCVNTLRMCMMEHYVDCPWREQALYAFDSRNQMLCGYYAFDGKNRDYARANLKLIGEDKRNDGLLSICYPCGTELAIPSFSLYYILAMKEYALHTKDLSLAEEKLEKMRDILDEFISNSEDGIMRTFSGKQMWNFYDWSPYSDGALGKDEQSRSDLAVNCLFVIALEAYREMCQKLGAEFPYDSSLEDTLKSKMRKSFLCQNGLFTMHEGKDEYTVLGNSLALLAKIPSKAEAEHICEAIVRGELIDCSLSMKVLEYEALLLVDEKYADFVLGEIRQNYKFMLDSGSDTVWETLKGEADFGGAGSLCHGWSSVPVYFYHKLGIAIR